MPRPSRERRPPGNQGILPALTSPALGLSRAESPRSREVVPSRSPHSRETVGLNPSLAHDQVHESGLQRPGCVHIPSTRRGGRRAACTDRGGYHGARAMDRFGPPPHAKDDLRPQAIAGRRRNLRIVRNQERIRLPAAGNLQAASYMAIFRRLRGGAANRPVRKGRCSQPFRYTWQPGAPAFGAAGAADPSGDGGDAARDDIASMEEKTCPESMHDSSRSRVSPQAWP